MAVAGRIRRNVLDNLRASADNRKLAYPDKLMYGHQAADYSFVFNSYMARKRAVVGNNAVTPYNAIMRNMRIGHKKIIISDNRPSPLFCAGIKCAIFTDYIPASYI